ncbi:MAG: response regulator, partial [bacterium]|nr:response regulator [bacterium]
KFTPPGGKVEVTVKRNPTALGNFPAGSIEISVSDTGPGIPREQLAHIFDRFYQADSTFEHHQKGSGIGLALAKELVELHRGTIEAGNRNKGGSEFIIRLPIGRAHLSAEPSVPVDNRNAPANDSVEPFYLDLSQEIQNENGHEIQPGTQLDLDSEAGADKKNIILVVEDSVDLRGYIRGALETGYRVLEARDGRAGIQKAREIIPDLIISDVMMPVTDGYELCSRLKNDIDTSHIPIILLTAKASEENILQGLETGADDYVTKPFSTKILIARIKNLIDIRSQLQTNINREMTLQPVKTSLSRMDRRFLNELHDVIDRNLSDWEFNVESLVKKLRMSRATLYRKVQALSALTPNQFIQSYRLKRGAELLKQSSRTVQDVAFEVGFGSPSYFSKCFKEKFQRQPSEYQAANQQ